jgi:TPR repeat protein
VGDHVEARRHFQVAAQLGSPLGQYNLAMMLLYREGGPCDAAQAIALLRKSADAGIDLARAALNQTQDRTTAANKSRERHFPCRLPRQAHFIAVGARYWTSPAKRRSLIALSRSATIERL